MRKYKDKQLKIQPKSHIKIKVISCTFFLCGNKKTNI